MHSVFGAHALRFMQCRAQQLQQELNAIAHMQAMLAHTMKVYQQQLSVPPPNFVPPQPKYQGMNALSQIHRGAVVPQYAQKNYWPQPQYANYWQHMTMPLLWHMLEAGHKQIINMPQKVRHAPSRQKLEPRIFNNNVVYGAAHASLLADPNRRVTYNGVQWHAGPVFTTNYNKQGPYKGKPISVHNNALKDRVNNASARDKWLNLHLPETKHFKAIPSLGKEREYNKPHFLVLPKKAYKDFADFLNRASDDEKCDLQSVLRTMPHHSTIYTNSGRAHEIPYFHVHVKPQPHSPHNRDFVEYLRKSPAMHNNQAQHIDKQQINGLHNNMRNVGGNNATLAQNERHAEIAIFDVDDTLINEKTGKPILPMVQEFKSLVARGVRPIICTNGQSKRIIPLMEDFLNKHNCTIADHFYPDAASQKFVHEQAKTIDKIPITLISSRSNEIVKPKYAAEVAKIFPRAQEITVYGDNPSTDGALAQALKNNHYPRAQVRFYHVYSVLLKKRKKLSEIG